ncbi:MAG: hypothetical protein COC01_07265 [Bacteroidetes bacterium]|nr:MAG: hypothetical protein COC01_07265 [Bacteroidota bacterium]
MIFEVYKINSSPNQSTAKLSTFVQSVTLMMALYMEEYQLFLKQIKPAKYYGIVELVQMGMDFRPISHQ